MISAQTVVLVVDDNPIIARMLRDLLAHEGLTVHVASDAASCRKSIEECNPSVLVLDIQLPDEDGLSVARKLKGDPRTSHIVIVGVTSHAMKGDKERAMLSGCDCYVPKPIDTRTFTRLIAGYCATAAAR